MLFVAGWLVLAVFWYFIYRTWRDGQHKLAVACIALWIVGRIWLPGTGLNGGLLFTVVAAVLCLILIYADLIRRTLPRRKDITTDQLPDQQDNESN